MDKPIIEKATDATAESAESQTLTVLDRPRNPDSEVEIFTPTSLEKVLDQATSCLEKHRLEALKPMAEDILKNFHQFFEKSGLPNAFHRETHVVAVMESAVEVVTQSLDQDPATDPLQMRARFQAFRHRLSTPEATEGLSEIDKNLAKGVASLEESDLPMIFATWALLHENGNMASNFDTESKSFSFHTDATSGKTLFLEGSQDPELLQELYGILPNHQEKFDVEDDAIEMTPALIDHYLKDMVPDQSKRDGMTFMIKMMIEDTKLDADGHKSSQKNLFGDEFHTLSEMIDQFGQSFKNQDGQHAVAGLAREYAARRQSLPGTSAEGFLKFLDWRFNTLAQVAREDYLKYTGKELDIQELNQYLRDVWGDAFVGEDVLRQIITQHRMDVPDLLQTPKVFADTLDEQLEVA